MIQIFSRERDTLSSEGEIGEGHLGFEVKLSAKPSSYLLPFSMIPLAAAASRVRIINLGNGANWGGRLPRRSTDDIHYSRSHSNYACRRLELLLWEVLVYHLRTKKVKNETVTLKQLH